MTWRGPVDPVTTTDVVLRAEGRGVRGQGKAVTIPQAHHNHRYMTTTITPTPIPATLAIFITNVIMTTKSTFVITITFTVSVAAAAPAFRGRPDSPSGSYKGYCSRDHLGQPCTLCSPEHL